MTDVLLASGADARARTRIEEHALEQPAARRRPSWLSAGSPVPTLIGLVVVVGGFGLLGIAWGRIARETNVALQLPYLVSAGLTGLGLIMAGLVVVNISAKRQDAAERARQMDQLTLVLRELKASLDEDASP
ncbi:MAG: hypothetical protein QOE05_3026 [Actinomycetota bacterium]|jgi:hypothetical protein|nr:hypothetical protein [Actinomycetota bacterium]